MKKLLKFLKGCVVGLIAFAVGIGYGYFLKFLITTTGTTGYFVTLALLISIIIGVIYVLGDKNE